MSNPVKAIIVRGGFTNAEFARVVALIREIDDARPDAMIEITAVDPDVSSLEAADRIMRDVLPAMQNRLTEIRKLPVAWPAYVRRKSTRGSR